jgi:adenine-specific DNA-methyltransferase
VVSDWLDAYPGPPVPASWVPGASAAERTQLAALGGLVRFLGAGPTSDVPLNGVGPRQLRQWMNWGPTPPENVMVAGQRLMDQKGGDGLAELYSSTVAPRSRRRLGTFFTPTVEVQWMLRRWEELHSPPQSVIDVGAGVGAFTTAATEQWPDADIFAVDVNPVTLGMLSLRLLTHGHAIANTAESRGVRLVLEDYVAWASRQWGDLRGGRLVLGNPPYTRLQLLPLSERRTLGLAAAPLCGSRASLSALITAATMNLMRSEDGLCLLLPAQWLEAHYAVGLRRWLWESTHRRIDLHLFESDLFVDAHVDAVALIIGPVMGVPQPFVSSTSAHGGDDDEAGNRTQRDRTASMPSQWRSFFSADIARHATTGDRPLSDFGRVRRGVATGANSFFVVSEEIRKSWALPDSVLLPLLQRTVDYESDVVSTNSMETLDPSRRKCLLRVTHEESQIPEVAAYLADGEQKGTHTGVLCQARARWYDLAREVDIPDVIIGPASKTAIRFLENEASASITNNLYGLSWHEATSPNERTRILRWMRSPEGQQELFLIARTQSGGLRKIEPRAFNSLQLPRKAFMVDNVIDI